MQVRTTEKLAPYDGKPLERVLIVDPDFMLMAKANHENRLQSPDFICLMSARNCVRFRYQPALYRFWVNSFKHTERLCEVLI
jgi:hypothetical protein